MRVILNVIWLVLCGLWMALAYAVAGLIIGIPLRLANFKIIPVTLAPLGVRIVPEDNL